MVKGLGLLMEMLSIVYGMAAFFGKKVKFDIKTVSFIIAEILLTSVINECALPVYLFSLSYIIVLVYGLIEYEEGIKETLLSCLLTFGIVVALQQIFYFTIFSVLPNNQELYNIFLINAGCFLILWGLLHYDLLNRFYKTILKSRIIYIGLLLFICVCLLIDLLEAKSRNYLSGKDYLQILYFTGLMVVVIAEWQKTKIETEKRKTETEINLLYYSAFEELIMLIRDRQHDIKNHINTIYSIIYTANTYEELVERQKQYCDFVLESGKETQILLAVNNPLIAGFLYQKEQEIKRHNIEVDHKLEVIVLPLIVSEYEIIEMMGILIDNAIEALLVSGLEKKKIIVGYKREEQWDIFYVSNTSRFYSKEEIEKFFQKNYSSKGFGRGIGLDKIRRKLKRLDGGIKVTNISDGEEKYLEFSIMLPIKE